MDAAQRQGSRFGEPRRSRAPTAGRHREHGTGRSCHNWPLSDAALVLQVLDRGSHLVSVPRRPVVGFGQPRHPGIPAGGDQLDREMLRAVLVAQGQEPRRLTEARSRTNIVAPVGTASTARHRRLRVALRRFDHRMLFRFEDRRLPMVGQTLDGRVMQRGGDRRLLGPSLKVCGR